MIIGRFFRQRNFFEFFAFFERKHSKRLPMVLQPQTQNHTQELFEGVVSLLVDARTQT